MALKQEFVVSPQELWVTAKSMDNSETVIAIEIIIARSKKKTVVAAGLMVCSYHFTTAKWTMEKLVAFSV